MNSIFVKRDRKHISDQSHRALIEKRNCRYKKKEDERWFLISQRRRRYESGSNLWKKEIVSCYLLFPFPTRFCCFLLFFFFDVKTEIDQSKKEITLPLQESYFLTVYQSIKVIIWCLLCDCWNRALYKQRYVYGNRLHSTDFNEIYLYEFLLCLQVSKKHQLPNNLQSNSPIKTVCAHERPTTVPLEVIAQNR